MTHPLFRQEFFIETAFARRFLAMLRFAWHQRSWHVIVADPGAGKSMSIRDLRRTTGSPAILAVTAPKNDESEQALGNQLFTALGLKLSGRWSERKPRLMGHLHQYGTECLIVDDAQDLELSHLMLNVNNKFLAMVITAADTDHSAGPPPPTGSGCSRC